ISPGEGGEDPPDGRGRRFAANRFVRGSHVAKVGVAWHVGAEEAVEPAAADNTLRVPDEQDGPMFWRNYSGIKPLPMMGQKEGKEVFAESGVVLRGQDGGQRVGHGGVPWGNKTNRLPSCRAWRADARKHSARDVWKHVRALRNH